MSTKQPAVAGLFYPDDPKQLRREIEAMLAAAAMTAEADAAPRGLVAPHAGYVYSGPIAASAYVRLAGLEDAYPRVVILGPSHRVAFRGLALADVDRFATPLGALEVARELTESALAAGARLLDAAHAAEHSIEVQLPFVQTLLPTARILPIVVGDASAVEVETVLEAVAGAEDTLTIVSTDLSHYLDHGSARRADRETTAAIEALRQDIGPEQACGCRPLNGMLRFAASRGFQAHALDVRTSGDTAGTKGRVVGYGAYAIQ